MTTDNRTNEPTEAQVEAAAKALAIREPMRSATAWENLHEFERSGFRESARAALVAAQGAAPQKHPTFEEIGEDIARGIRDSLSGVAPQVPSLSNSEILERIAEQEREAAGAPAPQEPNQTETKSGNNFVSLDPEQVAAQGAEPQAESADCDRDRMGICKRCGMGWDARKVLEGDFACPVLPSSGVDEGKLAEAERDAALAAIERVRAIHQKRGASWPHSGGIYVCGADNGMWPCPTVAALDGAPEPEEKP